MKVLIIDNHTKHIKKLRDLLRGNTITVRKREVISLGGLEKFDLVILSGGSHVCPIKNHHKEYKKEIDFLKKTDKPVIGICLGFEIIAVAFGSSLKELGAREKGICKIKFKNKKVEVYESHRFGISKTSDSLEVLAVSEDGPEAVKHKKKPIYGLQFHPEMFVQETDGDEIFAKIINELFVQCKK